MPASLSVSPCRRLERHRIHAGNFSQKPLQIRHQLQRALAKRFRQQGMAAAEAGKPGLPFIGFGVVFHGAGPQGVEARIHAKIPGRQPGVMPDHIDLGKIGKVRAIADKIRRQGAGRDIAFGHGKPASAFPAFFPEQFFVQDQA